MIWDDQLKFREELTSRVQEANNIMGVIRRTYVHLDESTFKLLFKSLVRSHLEYGAPVWDPHYKKDKGLLEGVQRRATSQIPSLKDLTYTERLRKLGLPTLRFRRLRGDIIEKYSTNHVYIIIIFIDFRVCDFAFAFKTQNAPCVSRFKRILFSDRFQFAS